jgi:hypothetical protein
MELQLLENELHSRSFCKLHEVIMANELLTGEYSPRCKKILCS